MADFKGIMIKAIATTELRALLAQFLLGNSYLLFAASPACCSDNLHPRVALLSGLLLLVTVIAATILASAVSSAQAFQKRASLRVLLLLAIGLSVVSTFLVVPTVEAGYGYCTGRILSRYPLPDLMELSMAITALGHGLGAFMVAYNY